MGPCPRFDIVSEVDLQEVRNAVDQANREATTRFDFKNTDSAIELGENELVLHSSTEDRLRRSTRCSRRSWSGARSRSRRSIPTRSRRPPRARRASGSRIKAGISQDHAKRLNRFIKDLGLKGVSSQTQGDQLRVTGKKRDDLQAVIAACKDEDFGIPLQFNNFRD